jgi:CheY-specific phosphatase CheX
VTAPDRTVGWWTDLAAQAIAELAQASLGLPGADVLARDAAVPEPMYGAVISLIGEADRLEIGLFSDSEGCARLASLMLGMEPEDDDMVVDAVCELSNVLAGLTKRKLGDASEGFDIGLPLYIRGSMSVPDHVERAGLRVRLGQTDVSLLLLRTLKEERLHAAATGTC